MAGWILPAIDGLRWLVHSVTSSTPAYEKGQPDHTQVIDKITGSLTRPFLESSMDKLFQKLRLDSCYFDHELAQHKCAYLCADWICEQTTPECSNKGTITSYTESDMFVIKVVHDDCRLELKETTNGITTTATVLVDSLTNSATDQRLSSLLSKLSTSGFTLWNDVMETWLKFSRILRHEALSSGQLVLHGKYGERIKIKCKKVKTTIAVILNDKEQGEIVFEVDEINKRTLGRLILWLCGNEGASHTSEQAALRRLIQACITSLEKRNKIWKNTKLSVYGQGATSFHIQAGRSLNPNHIVGFLDSQGDFQVVERNNSSCVIS